MTTTSEAAGTDTGRDHAGRRGARAVGVYQAALAALVAFGVAMRVWLLVAPMGALDGDTAVPGLMALHIRRGELPLMYWGSPYGGSVEAFLAAFASLVVPLELALKLLPELLAGAAAVLTWRIGRRLVGERPAQVGAVLFWVSPGAFVWFSTRTQIYWAALCLTLLAVLLLLRLHDEEEWRPPLVTALGVVVGLAWWSNPQAIYVLLPAFVYFARGLWRRRRHLPLLAAATALGASPWLLFSVRHDWITLDPPPQPANVPNSYVDHLEGFFRTALPKVLGVRELATSQWVPNPAVGKGLYLVVLGAFAVAVVSALRTGRHGFLVFSAAAYPFLFAVSPLSWFVDFPRYLLMLWPIAALLLGYGLTRFRLWLPGLASAALVSLLTLIDLNAPVASEAWTGVPPDLGPAKRLLEEQGVRYAFADYWLAYPLTLEARERLVITPLSVVRYEPYDEKVRASSAPAYVFLRGSEQHVAFRKSVATLGVPVTEHERDTVVVVKPVRKVLPEDLPDPHLHLRKSTVNSGAAAGQPAHVNP